MKLLDICCTSTKYTLLQAALLFRNTSTAGRPGGLMVVLEHYYKGWSRGFKSRYGGMETFIFQLHLLPVALHSVGNHNSTRVDEGRKC